MTTTMRSVRFTEVGKPADVLTVEHISIPEPKPGEVRIRVKISPVNPSDTTFVQNLYGIKPQLPSGAGFEGMGIIDAVSEGVLLKPGMRVSFTTIGAWSEYVTVPAKSIIIIPDTLPDETAAQLFVNPFTAYAMVQESGVQAGEWLLLTAAGSAFGQMVIQLCKMKGIRTIGTVRRNDMITQLKELGADEIINTEEEKLPKRVMEITGGKGVPCVLDAVGGKTGAAALQSLSYGGTMLVYGLLSMENIPVNSGLMIFKALHIRGFWLTDWMRHANEQRRQEVKETVIELLSSGQVKLPVEAIYPVEQIKQAVLHADAPGRTGKILISL